ncbi:testis-specific serine/threonine-protein kinase 1 isoform X2 [Venturia canescens]|nr:testis-specific serine/threonine-protein kinase 1 isoform X2 [Venturia canescens]
MRLACKIFDKEKAPVDCLEKFFPRELEILTKIENPHIIQIHSILQRGPRVFIFMRCADNGDLLDFVKRNGPVIEQQSKLWFRQMASGLHYLHSKNIAHRDLKCENILLSRKFNVKLADFGFARFCVDDNGRRVLSETYCGSAAYAAPEVVSGTPYNPKLADVWSLGIILFIMLNERMPFNDENLRQLLKDQMSKKWVYRARVQDTISPLAKSIIRHILEPDITLRLTLDRVLGHEWVRTKKDKSASIAGRLVHSAPPIHPQVSNGGSTSGGAGNPLKAARMGLGAFKASANSTHPTNGKATETSRKETTTQPSVPTS